MSDASAAAPTEMPEEKPVKPKSSKKPILVTALIAFLLGGGAGGYVALTAFPAISGQEVADVNAKNENTQSIDSHADANIIQVNRITLTMNSSGGEKARSLLVTPVLAVHPTGEAEEDDGHGSSDAVFSEMVPELRDNFIEYLSQLEPRDLAGSAGMSMLRAELKRRANAILDGYSVDKVLFSDFVIQ